MSRKIILKSSDDVSFEVDEAVARQSEMIKQVIEGDRTDNGIQLPNVTSLVLAKVIEYCKKHVQAAAAEANAGDKSIYGPTTDLKAWDADFVKVHQPMLLKIMQAANDLNIQGLIDLTFNTVTEIAEGKTPEEVCDIFHIMNDYKLEEEAEIRAMKSKT